MLRLPIAIAVVYSAIVIQSTWIDPICRPAFTPRLLISLTPLFVFLPSWGAVFIALVAGVLTAGLSDQPFGLPCLFLLAAAWLQTSERVGINRRPVAAALFVAVLGSLWIVAESVVAVFPDWRSIDWLATARLAWGIGLASAACSAPLCWIAAKTAPTETDVTALNHSTPRWRRGMV